MAIRVITPDTPRVVDAVYEGRAGFQIVEVDASDGSLDRGYQRIADGKLFSLATMVVSAARQTALDTLNAAVAAENTTRQTFIASIVALAQKVKDNTATAGEQRQLMVKLSRAAIGLLSDLP